MAAGSLFAGRHPCLPIGRANTPRCWGVSRCARPTMTSIAVAYVPVFGRLRPSFALLLLAVISTALLAVFGEALPWAAVYPAPWEVRVDTAISLAIKWLINDADFGLFTFKQMTRALGALPQAWRRSASRTSSSPR